MKQATLCLLVKEDRILLGMKKRGFGKNKYNGFGGKPDEGESIEQAAVRELHEESGVKTTIKDLNKAGELTFIFENSPDWNQVVHVYRVENWTGEPVESEEMKPDWFHFDDIPYDSMWADDKHWLPKLLNNESIDATFVFGEDNETIKETTWHE